MTTIWQTRDRQGVKYFTERPTFVAMHDFFTGKRYAEPKNRQRVRIIKRFKVKVTGQMVGSYGYKPVMKVG